jgi:hypothetical protein
MNKKIELTPQEAQIIIDELEDSKDHLQALLDVDAFNENDVEKETQIKTVDIMDNVIDKLLKS